MTEALDEVAFYKRLLTANERAWLYNSGQGRSYSDLNLPPANPTAYSYADPAHKHAVTSLSTGETYTYDANGNMIQRVENGLTYTQTFDFENRLASVTVNGQTTQFVGVYPEPVEGTATGTWSRRSARMGAGPSMWVESTKWTNLRAARSRAR